MVFFYSSGLLAPHPIIDIFQQCTGYLKHPLIDIFQQCTGYLNFALIVDVKQMFYHNKIIVFLTSSLIDIRQRIILDEHSEVNHFGVDMKYTLSFLLF